MTRRLLLSSLNLQNPTRLMKTSTEKHLPNRAVTTPKNERSAASHGDMFLPRFMLSARRQGEDKVQLVTEKWGGKLHYAGPVHYLGDDHFGTWLWGETGRHIYRGGAPVIVTAHEALILVPSRAWWTVTWWVEHPTVEIYVNVSTPVVRHPGRMVSVDLDLDVIRFRNRAVEIIDQDEFEAHQRLYDYPPNVIQSAQDAANLAADKLTRSEPPFDGPRATAWVDYARRRAG